MAAALLQEISQDEHERARLRSRKMYEMDRVSDLLTAEEKGEIKGRDEEKRIIARNLLVKGSTPEFVQEITGLNLKTIQELASF